MDKSQALNKIIKIENLLNAGVGFTGKPLSKKRVSLLTAELIKLKEEYAKQG